MPDYKEDEDIVAQVRRFRAELIEEYGSAEAYNKHVMEQQAAKIAQGVKYSSPKDAERSPALQPV